MMRRGATNKKVLARRASELEARTLSELQDVISFSKGKGMLWDSKKWKSGSKKQDKINT